MAAIADVALDNGEEPVSLAAADGHVSGIIIEHRALSGLPGDAKAPLNIPRSLGTTIARPTPAPVPG